MKRCRRRKQYFIPSLIQYLLTVSSLGLLLSCPLWLHPVCSCLSLFFSVSLPSIAAVISSPKCLFVVCSVIVVFLIWESKLSRSYQSADIYGEYIKSKVKLERQAEDESKKGSVMNKALDEEDDSGGGEGMEVEYEDLDGEEEDSSEIDKKAADFIARVNWQRRLEARSLLH
ncbi:hypothetical protein BHE74_00037950 [Ensete ventricosum]|nr:hypothetical protein B296_00045100 [Ensete ventricosum]RWV87835.1 hypothetical protein GW17_00050134 [Ensete ventricosum]RWW55437.1 hypothetical protein BHE74_00037950 [Ensete ventricosum]RZS17106.1 hypothetical protein BHM03_00049280 [Ensete ventricosum]